MYKSLENFKNNILKFSKINESDIRLMSGSDANTSFYKRTMLNFRNNSGKAVNLFHNCDSFNQSVLLKYFQLNKCNGLIESFYWIDCNIDETKLNQEEISVKRNNIIEYYYSLDEIKKQNLIKQYDENITLRENLYDEDNNYESSNYESSNDERHEYDD